MMDSPIWTLFNQKRTKHNQNTCDQTNKLILTLDRLINGEDSDIQSVPDDLVNLCPDCGKEFTLTKRRHHCRLCGSITCNSCSKFLEHKRACKLVKPAKLYRDKYDRIEDNLQNKDAEGLPSIRCCGYCNKLLDDRIAIIEDHYSQPSFLDFYDKLRTSMNNADDLILSQFTLINQHKQPTPELKQKIQDCKQTIASMGLKVKKMAELESGKQAFLLKSINQSILCWLKESSESKSNRIHGVRVDRSSGWVSEQSMRHDDHEDEDPILIQIKNLEEYIRQAREADRYEEVSALEANKRDLEIEYLLQKTCDL